jgi:hypothetical protein
MRTSRFASYVLVALALAGCAQDPTTDTSDSTSSSSPSASASATPSAPLSSSTSVASPAVTSSSSPAVVFPESQQAYTSLAVRAWGVGDRAKAGRYATDAAIREWFGAISSGGPGWALIGCDNAGPRPACTFGDPGQGQRLVLFYDADRLGRPRAVVDVEFILDDPTVQVQ